MKTLLTINLIIIFNLLLTAQNIEQEIQNLVNMQIGQEYLVLDVQSVDENRNVFQDTRYEFSDPYNTLNNCYIFLATSNWYNGSENPRGFVGIFKNGSIIWYSEPVINTESVSDQRILGTMDMNNDGKVEIITSWFRGMREYDYFIWIFSWDGINGYLINEIDQEEDQSVIVCNEEKPKIADFDGDGALEILGFDPNTYDDEASPIIYSWNGYKYGNYGFPIPLYIPMNLLSAKVSCRVTPSQYGLTFTYTVSNDSTSRQPIWKIAVEKMFDLVYNFSAPNKWQGAYSWEWDNLLKWIIIRDSRFYPYNLIEPGNTINIMSFTTDSIIPFISTYYVQGKNGELFPDDKYIFENSFKGKTICGKNPPEPFLPLEFLDTLLNYNTQSYQLGWITNQPTTDKYDSLFNLAKTQLQQNNNNAVRATLQIVLQQVDNDSTNNLTSEAYALIRYNTEYLIGKITEQPSSPNLVVNLKNSQGIQIPASNVTYYDNGWKDAVNNGDGTFTVITTKPKVSIRVYYEYASLQADNVIAQNNTYTFQTVRCTVQLKNSQGELIDTGTVQYYAGAWRSFGTTTNGVATKELLPINYSFRMTYAYASIDKQQNLSVDPLVVFQTVNAQVQLKNSQGELIDTGTVQYYAGAWRSFGTTTNGVATKELLPINYSFRMTYEYVTKDKQQNISTNAVVDFVTVLCSVKVSNTNNQPLNNSNVKYYAGSWRDLGVTNAEGIVTKELLPQNISFRASYGSVSQDKQQDIGVNSLVEIQIQAP